MRRRASAAVTGLRKRLSAASIEPPSVPVFFNLLPDAEMWPKTGRIGEQRLTLVQYWRQMQRGMAPDQGADGATAAETTAFPEPSVEQAGPTIYVNGQPMRPDQTVLPVEPAAPAVTLLGPSTIVTGSASGPHTAFKLEDFDDELDDDRASSSETKSAADASTWAPASTVFALPPHASEPAEVDAPTPAPHAVADETPAAAMDAAPPVTPPMPMPGVLQAAGILLDPPPAADTAETPVAELMAFGKEPEPVDAGLSGEAVQPSEAVDEAAPADVADVAAVDVVEVTTFEPASARAPEPAEIVAFEPDLELGSLEGFIQEPARARASDVEIADLAADAFVVDGSEAAFASFGPARQVDHAAGGFDAFAVDFLNDSASDLSAVAGPMVESTSHDLASQGSVPNLQLEALMPAEPVSFETFGNREPLDDVSLDASVLVGERAEPIFEVAADEPVAEPLVDAAPDERIVEAVIEDAIAEPAAAIAEAVVDVAAEEAALDPIPESIVAEPVADHAEPLVEMGAPEPHDAGWEQPEAHAPVAHADFVAPIAADASSREPHDEVGDAIEVSIPAASASTFVAPLTDDARVADAHDEEAAEMVDLPAASSASTFVAPLTDDARGAEAHDEEATEMVDLPAASPASTFVAPLTAEHAADHGDHHDDVVEAAHQLEMPVAAASTFAAPLTADAMADDHGGDAASADLHQPAALADNSFADVMHAGLEHAAAGEPADGARGAADTTQMPVFEADGVWSDAMTEWATTTRDTRLRRAGVIPMPASKPLPVPVVSTRSAIPALERFMRSAQARRRRVSSESVA